MNYLKYLFGFANIIIILGAASMLPQARAGELEVGSISGVVFEDENGDGVKGAGEKGIEHWAVYLVDMPWLILNADANGAFAFSDVPAGTHTVCVESEDLWQQTAPVPPAGIACNGEIIGFEVEVPAGSTVSGLEFGMFHAFTITGKTFEDVNGNSDYDGLVIDKNLPGREIRLTRTDGTAPNCLSGQASEPATLTGNTCTVMSDTSGNYKFKELTLGEYSVVEMSVRSWVVTLPASLGTEPATYVLAGESNDTHTRDFGNFKTRSVVGHVIDDENMSGTWDRGEGRLAGWTVVLTDPFGVESTTLTDSAGKYVFSKIGAGEFTISQVLQKEWEQISPNFPYVLPSISGENLLGANFLNHLMPAEVE